MKPNFTYSQKPALEPKAGCAWADTMLLNPAIIKDFDDNTLHMLFRATGPWPQKRMEGSPYDPYPIFLGYAKSEDLGGNWEADFSRPALTPSLEYDVDKMFIQDDEGKSVINHSNGCVEDPRIFQVEGELYVTVASRMFPPGPYWLGEGTHTNVPKWAKQEENPFGMTAYKNDTVTVLWKLDLKKLKHKEYRGAFIYVCNLTDGNVDDNRDVFLFPERMRIEGKFQYVMLHRPHNPENYPGGKGATKPSIMLAAAENIKDFPTKSTSHKLFAVPKFDWEEERIGASWSPIKINDKEWLLAYHGKQIPKYGYTQSFMILRNKENDFPEIIHRCSERLMYAKQAWELPDKLECPCMFSTGGIVVEDNLIISYGAADQKAGIAWVNFKDLVAYIRKFNEDGDFLK